MATFQVHITDLATGEGLANANLVFVDSANNPIADANGNPAFVQADASGNVTFTNGNPAVAVRVSYVGYDNLFVTLQPGPNELKLSANATLPQATIVAQASTFFQKHKTVILILLLLAGIFAAWKYKLIAL